MKDNDATAHDFHDLTLPGAMVIAALFSLLLVPTLLGRLVLRVAGRFRG